MRDKPLTIIISDLHLGGGIKDRGDDHIYQNSALVRFLEHLKHKEKAFYGTPNGIELFINGDFLEFAQVKQSVYKLNSAEYWCSEKESLQKLETILAGHTDIFAALKKFLDAGNRLTIAAGNHDVDLYWYGVRERLMKTLGPVEFALEKEWHFRYGNQLAIGHGHMLDPANRFKKWEDPVLVDNKKVPRLEMCPGTLFMVKFVNVLEKGYPFIDNIKPVTALMPILWKERRGRFWLVAWLFYKFIQQHPITFLKTEETSAPKILKQFSRSMMLRKAFAQEITKLYREVYDSKATLDSVRKTLSKESELFQFLYNVMAKVPPERWMVVFDSLVRGSGTLSIETSGSSKSSTKKARTLSIGWSHIKKERGTPERGQTAILEREKGCGDGSYPSTRSDPRKGQYLF